MQDHHRPGDAVLSEEAADSAARLAPPGSESSIRWTAPGRLADREGAKSSEVPS